MKVWSTLDYAFFESLSADPTVGVAAGRFYYHSVSKMMRWYNGTTWSEVVDTASAQTLAQKSFTAPVLGVASATSLAVSGSGGAGFLELAEQSSAPSNPAAAKLRVYGKTTDEGLYFLNSSGTESQVGSGSGEKNYLSTGSSTAASWATSGAGELVATDTTGAELPRPNTTKTGIKLTGVSGSTAYAYYRFILDDADAGKKLKVQFDMRPVAGYVASDFKIDVYSNTASDYTTGNTRLSLSTDSSAVSALPALTGTYRTTFDAPAVTAKWIEVRVGLNGVNTHSLVISDVVVGPGVVVQGAAMSGWTSYTPTITNLTLNATSKVDPNGWWRRVGDTMEVAVSWLNGSGGAATGGLVAIGTPTGYTVNTAALPTSVAGDICIGQALGYNIAPSTTAYDRGLTLSYNGGVRINKPASATFVSGTDFGASAEFSCKFMIPIAEWAGSGTVNVVQNDVSYLSHDGTSIVLGPAGALIPTATPAGTNATYVILAAGAVSASDGFVLEIQTGGTGPWVPVPLASVQSTAFDGTNFIGAGLESDSTSGVYIRQGKYTRQTGATTQLWSNISAGTRWRVKRFSGGQAVGFSEVQPGVSSGLVSASGLKGRSDGNSVSTGYVGEVVSASTTSASGTASSLSTLTDTGVSLQLTAGVWELMGFASLAPSGNAGIAGTLGGQLCWVDHASPTTIIVGVLGVCASTTASAATPPTIGNVCVGTTVSISGTKTYDLRFQMVAISGTVTTPTMTTSAASGRPTYAYAKRLA